MSTEAAQTDKTTVAIVDDDERLIAALVRDLGARGLRVHTAGSAQEALKLLEQHDVDVMLTDLRMSGRDGIDLIRAVGILSPNTRSILMSAFATAKDYKVAMELGAVDVLGKPFTPDELHAALEKAIGWDGSVRGDMQGISLTDVLTLFHSGRRSVTIRIGGTVSAIHLREGEIVHAEHGRLVGKEALRSLLSAPLGRVRTGALESKEQTIQQPFQLLLDEIVETLQKQRRTREVTVVEREGTADEKEVQKMSGPANVSKTLSPPGRAPGGSGRTVSMVIGGVMGIAAGIVLLALGLHRGSTAPVSEGVGAAVRQIDIDVSEWLVEAPAKPDNQRLAAGAADESGSATASAQDVAGSAPTEASGDQHAADSSQRNNDSSQKNDEPTLAAHARARKRRPPPRRARPRPEPVGAAPATPEPAVATTTSAPPPRKPSVGTIAAKQPAIGAVQSAKPVIGTVSR